MSKRRIAVITLFAGCSLAAPCLGYDENAKTFKEIGKVSDIGFAAVETAIPELRKQHPDWSDYTIDVAETDHTFVVSFCRKKDERKINFVDGTGKVLVTWPQCPGSFSVELDKVSLKILDERHNKD